MVNGDVKGQTVYRVVKSYREPPRIQTLGVTGGGPYELIVTGGGYDKRVKRQAVYLTAAEAWAEYVDRRRDAVEEAKRALADAEAALLQALHASGDTR